jgi:hypothetical protein
MYSADCKIRDAADFSLLERSPFHDEAAAADASAKISLAEVFFTASRFIFGTMTFLF